ncbi:MAG: aromatic amino acid transport family protein [Desulfotomaculaceae bacterium]|nr:aromatic amino acid transport family protein [Desulfotomaculaceae bacterium]MDD4766569.1 aromatic amino acid transport family protein [Desulfotomaculaceae bacterium]
MKSLNLTGTLLFTGTLVGAGILGLPYALSQSGFIGGTIIFIGGTFFAYLSAMHIGTLVHMENKEVSLYSIYRSYLGTNIGYLTLAGILFSSYGAMIAYPLAIGITLNSLLNIPFWLGAGMFIALITFLLSLNLGESNRFNALVTIVLILLLIWVILKSIPAIELNNYLFFKPDQMLGALGIIVFAFAGHIVIPSVLYYTKTNFKQSLRILNIGLFLVAALYFFFFIIAIGVMGTEVTPVATLGLGGRVSGTVALIGQVFAILAILTSAFGIGISLKLTFREMFKISDHLSLVLIIVPILLIDLYLSRIGGDAFIQVLNYAGGIGSALYVGIIPALIVQNLAKTYRFPLGRQGAVASLVFYSLVMIYTLFS